MQKARGHPLVRRPIGLPQIVGIWFQSFSLPSTGCFSPFPHGTCALSVTSSYLALEDGPPGFPRGFTCPVVLGNKTQEDAFGFAYGALTLCGAPSQRLRLPMRLVTSRGACSRLQSRPTTPTRQRLHAITSRRFGLLPVRSPLLGESLACFLLPAGTEMFHFPAFASARLWIQRGMTG